MIILSNTPLEEQYPNLRPNDKDAVVRRIDRYVDLQTQLAGTNMYEFIYDVTRAFLI